MLKKLLLPLLTIVFSVPIPAQNNKKRKPLKQQELPILQKLMKF
jgi:hypothetical protein